MILRSSLCLGLRLVGLSLYIRGDQLGCGHSTTTFPKRFQGFLGIPVLAHVIPGGPKRRFGYFVGSSTDSVCQFPLAVCFSFLLWNAWPGSVTISDLWFVWGL